MSAPFERDLELPLPMKLGRALFNHAATSFVLALRTIITWASPVPSVSSLLAAFAFAALARMKRVYSREVELNPLPLSDEGKLSTLGASRKGK